MVENYSARVWDAEFQTHEQRAKERTAKEGKHEVSQKEFKISAYERLLEEYRQWQMSVKELPLEKKYDGAVEQAQSLPRAITAREISDFCAGEEVQEQRDLGLFVSALVNNLQQNDRMIILNLRRVQLLEPIGAVICSQNLLDYFGFKLTKTVGVIGDLGDNTAYMMEGGHLVVRGNCRGAVGPYMKNGRITVSGTIRDVGAIRYGGKITYGSNLRDYHQFETIDNVRRLLRGEDNRHLAEIYRQIEAGKPVSLDDKLKERLCSAIINTLSNYNMGIYDAEINQNQRVIVKLNIEMAELPRHFRRGANITRAMTIGSLPILIPITFYYPLSAIITGPLYAKGAYEIESRTSKKKEDLKLELYSRATKIRDLRLSIEDLKRAKRHDIKFKEGN